ncbi:UNKNOWN [Stylonychia lemnae]|uniref:Uncharacterized protein n=1 Tax=Stylonychia lemnae TaxID=5949 RepID=A0A078AL24_STYLE|nr:UNKNOWN [Stylonychia lemnae]|eukprot:CDW82137.1 UNKNOWN [Stylonychia lemnae]
MCDIVNEFLSKTLDTLQSLNSIVSQDLQDDQGKYQSILNLFKLVDDEDFILNLALNSMKTIVTKTAEYNRRNHDDQMRQLSIDEQLNYAQDEIQIQDTSEDGSEDSESEQQAVNISKYSAGIVLLTISRVSSWYLGAFNEQSIFPTEPSDDSTDI